MPLGGFMAYSAARALEAGILRGCGALQEEDEDELGHEDAEEHGEGVDGAVADGGGVIACGGVGEGECGGIGVGTCDETHEGEVVQLHLLATDDAHDEDGDDGDEESHPDVVYAVAVKNGADEVGACLDAHAGEEEDEAYFTEEHIGGGGGVGVDLIAITEGADEDGYYEGTACETELDGDVDAGDGDGELTDEHTGEDAEEDGADVGVVEVLDVGTDEVADLINVLLAAGDHEAVAYHKAEVACSEEFHTITGDAGDVDAVVSGEVEVGEGLAVDFGLSDDHALADVVGGLFDRFCPFAAGDYFTDEEGDGFSLCFGAGDVYFHAELEFGVAVGDDDGAVLKEAAAYDELAVEEVVELVERSSYDGGVGDAYGHVVCLGADVLVVALLELSVALLEACSGEESDGDGGEDDADNAEGVSAGVTVGDGGSGATEEFGEDAVGGTETGGVGDGTVHDADHHGEVAVVADAVDVGDGFGGEQAHACAELPETEHDGHVEEHDAYGEEVHLDAVAALEDFEEGGTDLQTDAVDEEDKSELLDEVNDGLLIGYGCCGVVVEVVAADVANDDADEEHPGDAESDTVLLAANLPASELDAETDDEGVENHDVRNALRIPKEFD